MVIQKFNKLIRNKWVWGVFAILVSLAFVAPDEWFRGGDERATNTPGALENDEYDADLHKDCEFLVYEFMPAYAGDGMYRGGRRYLDMQILGLITDGGETVNGRRGSRDERFVWRAYAAVKAFREAGYATPDTVLAARIREDFAGQDGAFNDEAYKDAVRRQFRMEPKAFEHYLALWLTIENGVLGMAETKSWGSSMEHEQASRDFTDKFTVQVATFTQDKAAADAIKLDDEGLKAWYDKNISTLAVPERFKLNYIRLAADTSNLLASVTLDEEAIQTRYDENSAKGMYDVPPATTNDVKTVKPLADVRDSIESALRRELALESLKNYVEEKIPYFEDYDEATVEEAGKFLPAFAAENGAEIQTSGWLSLGSCRVPGMVGQMYSQFPGVKRDDFMRKAGGLARKDTLVESFASDRAVWVVTLAELEPAVEKPAFETIKDNIVDMATRDAKADAFKASVEEVAAKGVEAVLASGNVSTNLTFSPSAFASDYAYGWTNIRGEWDFKDAGFPNAQSVVFASRKLEKGEVSEFVSLGTGRAALVVCNDRVPGDVAQFWRGENFASRLSMSATSLKDAGKWLDWNLKRLGYKERAAAEPAAAEETDDGDDA